MKENKINKKKGKNKMKMIDRFKRLKVISTMLVILLIVEFFLMFFYILKLKAEFVEVVGEKESYYINSNNIITIFKNKDNSCNIKILITLDSGEEKITSQECEKLIGEKK